MEKYINQNEIEDLIELYSTAMDRNDVTSETLISGTPIWKFSKLDGGYQRIMAWCNKKLADKKPIDPMPKYNFAKVKEATRLFLEGIGEDLKDENVKDTPNRVAEMYSILLGGYDTDPKKYLRFFPAKSDDMVTLTNIPFYSYCSHHLLPFIGKLHIAYVPDKKVVGISKLVRFARIYAKRLNLQEDMTQNIADVLITELGAKGVIVRVEASHMCTIIRGIRAHGSTMVTTAKRGIFKTDSNLLNEFNLAIKDQGSFSY